MEADFSGYATKAGLKCSDGRTIMSEAFRHQDKAQVPLVWQHGHTDPENVLGHAILESRDDGVYAYGFFNDSTKAQHARTLLEHKDINQMSIWANELIERAGRVLHGAIREVSLVLSGANPGALIDNVTIRHSDGEDEKLDEEAIIYTGLELSHADGGSGGGGKNSTNNSNNDPDDDGDNDTGGDDTDDDANEATIQDIIDTMSEEQQGVLHYMVGEALKAGGAADLSQSNNGGRGSSSISSNTTKKGVEVKHNVFEDNTGKNDPTPKKHVLSHADVKGIIADATKNGSLKSAVENYALAHGIDNIDMLFPEVRLINNQPEFLSRRVEWVAGVLAGVSKSPFSRVKTVIADITFEDARAKGYIKGTMKKEEFFAISRRITTPATIYKKQKLDRDDILDITDFDVVTWMNGEMRIMLDEELARAILMGDGRDIADPDKISETNLRPILTDNDFFTVKVNVDITSNGTKVEDLLDAVLINRGLYKGTGTPTFYTTLGWLAKMLLIRDGMGRKIYQNKADLASALMVADIVAVEALETKPNVVGILVNLVDYNVGTDRGGEVNMFDFFDIDFNQQKYLIETRCSGALTRPRSAMVFFSAAANGDTPVTATGPSWNSATFTVTIPTDANVEYVNFDTGDVIAAGDVVLTPGEVLNVQAEATGTHYLTNARTLWNFLRPTS